jgi:hypothetical protein
VKAACKKKKEEEKKKKSYASLNYLPATFANLKQYENYKLSLNHDPCSCQTRVKQQI